MSMSDSMPVIRSFFEDFVNEVNTMLNSSVAEQYQNVASAIQPLFVTAFVAWIMWQAYQIRFGRGIQIAEIVSNMVKFVVIYTVIYTWSDVYQLIIDPFLNGIPELIAEMTGSTGDNVVMSFGDSLFRNVKSSITFFGEDSSGGSFFAAALLSVIMVIVGGLVIISYFIIVIEAKFLVALLLIVAPIFIAFLMFESTKGYFRNWISAMIMPMMTILLMNLTVGLLGGLIWKIFQKYMINGELEVSISAAVLAIIVGTFMFIMIRKASMYASNLISNGFGISSGNGAPIIQAIKKMFAKSPVEDGGK